MNEVRLRPARGACVYDIDEHRRMSPEGRIFVMPLSKYWIRRLKLGSVVMTKVRRK